MKNKTRRSRRRRDAHDRTERSRSLLYFLMFIEDKLICRQVYQVASMNMHDIEGFSEFIDRHSPE